MNVAVAPFLMRALRLNARTGRTYLLRTGVALLFLLAFAMVQDTAEFYGAPGLILFGWVVYASAVVICLSGPSYFASVISDEKEQMTLGLLKMTALRSFSLMTGLSMGQMVAAASLLLVVVPFAVLSVALGGVSNLQVWAATVALLAHLLVVAAVGLLCSVFFARSTRAGGAAFLFLLLFFLAPPIVYQMGRWAGPWTGLKGSLWEANRFLFQSSVFVRLSEILSTGFSGGIVGVQAISNAALAFALFLVSWALFGPCTRRTEGVAGATARTRLPIVRRLRPGRAWRAAVAWKEFHFMAGGLTVFIAKTVLIGIGLAALAIYGTSPRTMDMDAEDVGIAIIWFMIIITAIEGAIHASRMFNFERRMGTLSYLGTLPKSARRVAWEKIAGSVLSLLPYAAWFVVGALLAAEPVAHVLEGVFDEPVALVVIGVAILQYILFLHITALLSLLLKRGALLVAIVVHYIGGTFAMSLILVPFAMMGDEAFVAGVVCVATAGLVLLFHWLLIRRLDHCMAE